MIKSKKLSVAALSLLIIGVTFGCSLTTVKKSGPLAPREDIAIPTDITPIRYTIQVRFFNQNKIGISQSIDEIAATVSHYPLKDGGHVYRWDEYRFRHIELDKNETPIENGMDYDRINADDNTPWQKMEEVIGYSYYLKDGIAKDGQLSLLPNTDFVRKDLDGFRFYLNLIDFHSWDIYARLVAGLEEKDDVLKNNQEGHVIDLLQWDNVADHAEMEGGTIYVQFLGHSQFDGKPSTQFYFQQNQRLKMDVYAPFALGLEFQMPYTGTNRFMGVFELDDKRRLVSGRYNEYVYGKVKAPFFVNALTYHKHEYLISRITQ